MQCTIKVWKTWFRETEKCISHLQIWQGKNWIYNEIIKKKASYNGLIPYDQWLWTVHKNAFEHLQYCFTATSSKTFQIISFTKNWLALIEKASVFMASQYNPLVSNIKKRPNHSGFLQCQKRWSFPDLDSACKWDHCSLEADLSAHFLFIDYEVEQTNWN